MSSSRVWGPYFPKASELVYWKDSKHKIYDDFPDGQPVDPEAIGLDWLKPIKVVFAVDKLCWRKLQRTGIWIVDCYIAIKFHHEVEGKRTDYWTTWARGGKQWLLTSGEYESKTWQ